MKNPSVRVGIALGLVVMMAMAFTLSACKTTQTVGEEIDDTWISSKVKTKLAADPEINPFNIDVDTLNGAVTLSGIVPTQGDKQEAEKLARNTNGVTKVINNIKVEGKGTAPDAKR